MEESSFLNGRVIIKIGDITREKVDAIVNAANSSLMGGGGVDGVIHNVGGSVILEECKHIRKDYPNGLPTGQAVITTGGNLMAQYVIHTVGPIWSNGKQGEADLLRNCYINSLKLASDNKIKSIAFPAISTGIYGYPQDQAAKVSSTAIKDFLRNNSSIEKVILIFFKQQDKEIYLKNADYNEK